jgi:glycine/D-amino acid oxidase-like deaminating enzyme
LVKWSSDTLNWLIYLRKEGRLPLNPAVNSGLAAESNPYRVALVDAISYEATDETLRDRETWKEALLEPVKTVPVSELAYLPPAIKHCFILPQLPLVTTHAYLQRMHKELYSTGRVSFVQDKTITSITKAAKKYGAKVVINCAGLGARKIMQDAELHPIRGCLVTVKLPPEIDAKVMGKVFMYDDFPEGLTYILPREDGCHIGGTYLPNEWDTTVSDSEAKVILDRAFKVVPDLAQGKIIKQRAGLRPGRAEIKLGQDLSFQQNTLPSIHQATSSNMKPLSASETTAHDLSDTTGPTASSYPLVFHNYGHGGSGWTIHWGCATATAAMVLQALRSSQQSPSSLAKL